MTQLVPRRFTAEEFEQMGTSGVLKDCERVELIDGVVVEMSPIGDNHRSVVMRLTELLVLALHTNASVSVQSNVRTTEYDEPEPDVVVFKKRADYYKSGGATTDAALLLIEVADSSLSYDRGVKANLYARANVAEYWVADLVHDELLVHTDPRPKGYASVRALRRGDTVGPIAFPDVSFEITAILG